MPSQTNEQALESAIERALTGTCLEDLDSSIVQESPPNNGFRMGFAADFDALFAIDRVQFWSFLKSTQPEELEKLQKISGDWEEWRCIKACFRQEKR